jgi:hypothetical protein
MSRSRRLYDCLMPIWPWGKALNHIAGHPLVGPVRGPLLRPLFGAEGNEAMIIPVQETIRGTESITLPLQLLTPLIKSASSRIILDECMCRESFQHRTKIGPAASQPTSTNRFRVPPGG